MVERKKQQQKSFQFLKRGEKGGGLILQVARELKALSSEGVERGERGGGLPLLATKEL
jgi:hypothetical protein